MGAAEVACWRPNQETSATHPTGDTCGSCNRACQSPPGSAASFRHTGKTVTENNHPPLPGTAEEGTRPGTRGRLASHLLAQSRLLQALAGAQQGKQGLLPAPALHQPPARGLRSAQGRGSLPAAASAPARLQPGSWPCPRPAPPSPAPRSPPRPGPAPTCTAAASPKKAAMSRLQSLQSPPQPRAAGGCGQTAAMAPRRLLPLSRPPCGRAGPGRGTGAAGRAEGRPCAPSGGCGAQRSAAARGTGRLAQGPVPGTAAATAAGPRRQPEERVPCSSALGKLLEAAPARASPLERKWHQPSGELRAVKSGHVCPV